MQNYYNYIDTIPSVKTLTSAASTAGSNYYQIYTTDEEYRRQRYNWGVWQKHYREQSPSPLTPPKVEEKREGVEMKGLFDVYMVYAEDRKKPIINSVFGVVAESDEDAKIKSGLLKMIDDEWDADYLTFIVKKIGDVRVKERPKEVKQI